MNRSIMALIVLSAINMQVAAKPAPASLDEAKSLARLENKLILADFFAEW